MARALLVILVFALCACSVFAQEIDVVEDKARLGLAQSYINLEKFDDAAELFEKLYAKYPDNKEAAIGYARALAKTGDIDRALEILSGLVSKYPDDTGMILELSHMLATKQQYEQAIVRCQRATESGGTADYA